MTGPEKDLPAAGPVYGRLLTLMLGVDMLCLLILRWLVVDGIGGAHDSPLIQCAAILAVLVLIPIAYLCAYGTWDSFVRMLGIDPDVKDAGRERN